MPEFLKLEPPSKALNKFIESFTKENQDAEWMETADALGRVLAKDIFAQEDIPAFPRSTVDGYAIQSKDSFGASDAIPAFFKLIGEVKMGSSPDFVVGEGEAAVIHTGGMLPHGADSVVMIEHTQFSSGDEIEVYRSVGSGDNVIQAGEDVRKNDLVLKKGVKVRPAEIGGLLALGVSEIQVFTIPKVGVISTGDEIIEPQMEILPGQIRDINSYSLSALIQQHGGKPVRYGIVPDKKDLLEQTMRSAFEECDMVIVTAGSSASVRDHTAEVIQRMGSPGVLVHGVNVRPGKPTILAVCEGKPIIGLPGNPVSALVVAQLFVVPVVLKLTGQIQNNYGLTNEVRVNINVSSVTGREDWIPVKIIDKTREGEIIVEPIFYKSNLIFSLSKADGIIRVPPEANGLSRNDKTEMILL